MTTVTFTATFYGGEGSVIFDGEGIPENETLQTGGPITFNADQTSLNQSITATPVIPQGQAGDPGKITVQVTDPDGNVLSPASDNTYVPYKGADGNMVYSFDAFIDYALQ